jgi:hypothetical protein
MSNHINWEEIRNKYIYGILKDGKVEFPSTRDLAEEYNVSLSTIGDKASKEKWVDKREHYRNERRTKTEQKVINEVSDKIAPLDTYLFEKLDKFIRGIGGMIDKIFPEPSSEAKEPLKATDLIVFKTSDLFNIITSLKQAKELEKSVIGEGDNSDKTPINITVSSEDAKEITDKILKGERT